MFDKILNRRRDSTFNFSLHFTSKDDAEKIFFQVLVPNMENTYALTLSGLCHLICVATMNHTEPSIDLLSMCLDKRMKIRIHLLAVPRVINVLYRAHYPN